MFNVLRNLINKSLKVSNQIKIPWNLQEFPSLLTTILRLQHSRICKVNKKKNTVPECTLFACTFRLW